MAREMHHLVAPYFLYILNIPLNTEHLQLFPSISPSTPFTFHHIHIQMDTFTTHIPLLEFDTILQTSGVELETLPATFEMSDLNELTFGLPHMFNEGISNNQNHSEDKCMNSL